MLQATAKPAADTSLDLFFTVEQNTVAANKALAALPATCTHGSARRIQEAKIKTFGDFASCSVAGIIKDIAYILIDSADFGSAVWGDSVEFVVAIKACMNETTLLDRVECLDDTLSSSAAPFQGINEAIRHLVAQLIVIIPDIRDKIKTCQKKSTLEYNLFLDGLVKKAKTC